MASSQSIIQPDLEGNHDETKACVHTTGGSETDPAETLGAQALDWERGDSAYIVYCAFCLQGIANPGVAPMTWLPNW